MRPKQLSTIWQAALLAGALQDGQRKPIPEFGVFFANKPRISPLADAGFLAAR